MLQAKLKALNEVCEILKIPTGKRKKLLEAILTAGLAKIVSSDTDIIDKITNIDEQKIRQSDIDSVVSNLSDEQKNAYLEEVSKLLDSYVEEITNSLTTNRKEEILKIWNIN